MLNWITEHVAISGGVITSLSWPEVQTQTGVTAVLNLRAEQEDRFSRPLPLAYLWLPVVDHTDPSIEQLLMAAQFVDAAVNAGHKVLIHCMMGVGRSRTTACAYLIWTGLSVDEAIRRVEGTLVPEYAPQRRQVLERFAAVLKEMNHA